MFLSGGTFIAPSGNGMDYDYGNDSINGWGNRSFIEEYKDSQFRESLGEYTYNDLSGTQNGQTGEVANVKPKKKRVIIYTLID